MATELSIINTCLSNLGYPPIQNIDDTTFAAMTCKLHFETALNALLEAHTWTFAMRRKVLELYDKPDPIYNWEYRFSLPEDCLRVIGTYDDTLPYKVEGRYLLFNINYVPIVYVSKDINLQHVSYSFAEVMAAKLASCVANAINSSSTTLAAMYQLYTLKLREAMQIDNSASNYSVDVSEWLIARE